MYYEPIWIKGLKWLMILALLFAPIYIRLLNKQIAQIEREHHAQGEIIRSD